MDWIEVTARTVDDAKELALDRLGIVEDELEYQIVDEARSGLFGIGRTDARIRARVKPLSREKPGDRRRRRGSNERSRTRGTRPSSERSESGDTSDHTNHTGSAAGSNRRRRGSRRRSSSAAATAGASAATVVAENRSGAEVEVEQQVPVATQATQASEFTAALVRAMGFSASVRSEVDDEDITVHVEGSELGPLVGPRGATLHALEEVVRAVIQHHAGGRSAWVHVDVNHYRERRREALAEFARKMAGDVMDAGSPRVLEPMGAADRKVVHDTLAEVEGVTTASEGEDPRRRVVIRPA
jgi:spoIIIJ-associated protein